MTTGKEQDSPREIASLTKIMTCYLTCQIMEDLGLDPKSTFFTVSANADSQTGTSACLREGQQLSVYDCLYGLMLPSGNDAAVVIAENLGTYLHFLKEKKKLK